jgi:hypothetical protein
VTDWQSADDRNNREKTNRARRAAEDLFRPAQPAAGADLPVPAPNVVSPPEQQSRRQPRIFAVPSRVPTSAKIETPSEPEPEGESAVNQRDSVTVPPSQVGRIRALASYGMTRAQVAQLYGVTVDEIERVIRLPVYSGKSR